MQPKFTSSIALMLIAFVFAGCVPSWNPLYTDKDLVFDAKLVGTWSEDDEPWEFEKIGDKRYRLTHTDKDKQVGKFDAHLVKLGKYRFLDLYVTQLSQDELKANSLATSMLVPLHLFLRVDEIGDTLTMAMMNPGKVKEHLKKNPKAIAHRKVDDSIILTADTPDLQAYVIKHAEGEALFDGSFTLKRKSGT